MTFCPFFITYRQLFTVFSGWGRAASLQKLLEIRLLYHPYHPQDYTCARNPSFVSSLSSSRLHLLKIKWADKYYFDRCLPMSCLSSCAIFEAFGTALEWLSLQKLWVSAVLHILDHCYSWPLPHGNATPNWQIFSACAISLYPISQKSRLPPYKLKNFRTLLHKLHKRRTVTLR